MQAGTLNAENTFEFGGLPILDSGLSNSTLYLGNSAGELVFDQIDSANSTFFNTGIGASALQHLVGTNQFNQASDNTALGYPRFSKPQAAASTRPAE